MQRSAFHLKQVLGQASGELWRKLFDQCGVGVSTLEEHNDSEVASDGVWMLEGKPLAEALMPMLDLLAASDAVTAAKLMIELQRVHGLAVRTGIEALRNVSALTSPLHEAFAECRCDTERALWAWIHAPSTFTAAEWVLHADQRMGKRGWQRLQIADTEQVFCDGADLAVFELALGELFTKRGSSPRVCEVDAFERHLDGSLQLRILIEDDTQHALEFGDDDRTHWRAVRPPVAIDLIYQRSTGVIDVIAPGGAKARDQVVCAFGKHLLRKPVTPRSIVPPRFLLNRLKKGFDLPTQIIGEELDGAASSIARIRLLSAKFRAITHPILDATFKASPEMTAPDVFEGLDQRSLSNPFLSGGFDIVNAVVSVYFLACDFASSVPEKITPRSKPLHIELRPTGITNLREMSEEHQRLAQSLLVAWGVMEKPLVPNAQVAGQGCAEVHS